MIRDPIGSGQYTKGKQILLKTPIVIIGSTFGIERRHCYITLANFLNLNKPWSYKNGRKEWKNWQVWLSCTHMIALYRNKTTAHTFLSSDIFNLSKWLSLSRTIANRSRNFANHGNIMSHFSEMPTSGDLKSWDVLFVHSPPTPGISPSFKQVFL